MANVQMVRPAEDAGGGEAVGDEKSGRRGVMRRPPEGETVVP